MSSPPRQVTPKQVVIASNNAGKLREFSLLLKDFDFAAVPQAELNVPEPDEPHATFVENALVKARNAARITGLPALADDSGICVPALGGAPGVWSARYAGEPKSDSRNNEKLVAEMYGKADRRAFYYCVLIFLTHADDPHPLIAEGEWWGEILETPRGQGGFGYDPHFWLPERGITSAELPAEQKASLSHRGIALRALAEMLRSSSR